MRTPVHLPLSDCPANACLRRSGTRSGFRRRDMLDAASSSARRHPGRVLLIVATLVLGIGSCQLPQPPIPRLLVGVADGVAAHSGVAVGVAAHSGVADATERLAVRASRRRG